MSHGRREDRFGCRQEGEETEDVVEAMKPVVNRIASIPLTAVLSCHGCYQLISYDPDQPFVRCHACGITVRGPLSSLDSEITPG